MQKRLLALVATVAMVLSMFAGIAFAAPGDFVLTVTTTEVARNLTAGAKLTVTGTFTGTVATADDVVATVTKGTDTVVVTNKVVTSGTPNTFSFEIPGDTAEGTYTIKLEEVAEDNSGTATFKVVTANTYKMYLGTTEVISSGESPLFQTISGTIARSAGTASPITNFVVQVWYKTTEADAVLKQSVHAPNGVFTFLLPTDIAPQNVELRVFEANDDWTVKGGQLADFTGAEKLPIIKVRYNVTTTPTNLTFAFTGAQTPVSISGKVTDSTGKPVTGKTVTLVATEGQVVGVKTATTNEAGEFGLIVLEWKAALDYKLQVVGVDHKTVKVTPKAATLTVTPNTGVVSKLADAKLELTGSGFGAETALTSLKLYKGTTIAAKNEVADFADVTSLTKADAFAGGAFTKAPITWDKAKLQEAGTYTLVAVAGHYSASTTIAVVSPAKYNLIDESGLLTELKVDTNPLEFGIGNDIYLLDSAGNVNAAHVYTVYVNGKLAKMNGVEWNRKATGTATITPTKLATYDIRVVVELKGKDNENNDTFTKIFDSTYTSKVNGLAVDVDVTELTVNKKQTITFVVKDANGVPVNNATVSFDGTPKASYTTANIQNGTYIVKDFTPGTVAPIKVTVVENVKNAKATLTLNVVGDKVYSVTADVDTLRQGKGEDVELTVMKDGVAVMPQRVRWVYEDGTVSDPVYPTYLGDGISKVKVNAAEAGKLIVRVENSNGTLCGEVALDVVAPQLVLIDEDAANLTNNFESKVAFKVVDPRDNSVIKDTLTYKLNYGVVTEISDADDIPLPVAEAATGEILGSEEYVLSFLVKVTPDNWKAAKAAEKVVALSLLLGEVELDGKFEVKDATITSDPEMIVIGAKNNLTLTYADANGQPIVGKVVTADGVQIDETDDNGQVIYPAGVVGKAVVLEAATDTDAVVEKTIKIGYDFEAPKVTHEVNGDKATLVITDNVRLVRVNIGGKEIDFWPGAKYVHNVTLKPGVNKFAVKAQDSNDNVLDEVVEIEYKTDAVVLKGELVKRQGAFNFVQARQFEELGAKFTWNNTTKTASFVLGETKVEVTIGSTTAMVNGKAVTMPAAPFIENERTYIPVRFISEALGWKVDWAVGDIVTISLP